MTEANKNAVVVVPAAEPNNEASAITPLTMLNMAVAQGADLDKLEKLMALQERWEANEARKAYVSAMNAFKTNPPDVYKNKHVAYKDVKYDHALLEDAVDSIGAALSKHGLSFRWDVEQLDGGLVRVSCIVTHAQGHSEKTAMQAGLDSTGSKNNIQALGSTATYLQRYTLFAATGLAAKGIDDDGGGSETEYITAGQAADLTALLEEVGADKQKFLDYFKIGSVERLPAQAYKQALALTESKRKRTK